MSGKKKSAVHEALLREIERKEKFKRLREASGEFNSKDKLTCFLYMLMRDGLPCGVVEGIMLKMADNGEEPYEYCNGWLAQYADDIRKRLLG